MNPRARRLLVTALHGFSSGLPLLAIGSTLQAWLTDSHVGKEQIGLYNLVGVPYTLKFLWAPWLDRIALPWLGRRRGWLVVFQLLLATALGLLGTLPADRLPLLVGLVALMIAFLSASQDILIDAYRRESLPDDELALGSSLYVTGYRIAMIASGGGALALTAVLPWTAVYACVGALGAVGLLATFVGEEPVVEDSRAAVGGAPHPHPPGPLPPSGAGGADLAVRLGVHASLLGVALVAWLVGAPANYAGGGALIAIALAELASRTAAGGTVVRTWSDTVVAPLRAFLTRDGAIAILAFVLLYKLGDNLATALNTRFYKELGFKNEEIGAIAKTFGMLATIGGGLAGGAVTMRIGTNRALWILGLFQALSIGTFVILAVEGHDYKWLTAAILAESLTMGASTSAYVAFLGAQTDKRYTATQYALLSALMGVPRTLAAAPTGYLAAAFGWPRYFVFCMAMAIPGYALLTIVAPWRG